MQTDSVLIPIRDILDLLENIDYNENTIDILISHVESALRNKEQCSKALKSLNYFILHKKCCKSSRAIFEKTLKSCLNFLHLSTSNSDINPVWNCLTSSIIDSCIFSDDINSMNHAYLILLDFIKEQYLSYRNAKSDSLDVNVGLVYLFLVMEKLCILKREICSFSSDKSLEEIPWDIFNEITKIIRESPLEFSKNVLASSLSKYIASQENSRFLESLWIEIEQLEGDEAIDKQLFYLCLLHKNFVTIVPNSFSHPLYVKPVFWEILQNGLINNNSINRKISLYLLRRYVDLFNESKINFEGQYFYWNYDKKKNLVEFWYQLFVLFETLEEKQVHLITPALKTIPDLCQMNLIKCYTWLLCVFERIISHSSNTIVKWGIHQFCMLNTNELFSDRKCTILLHSFFKSLNNMFLYNVNSSFSEESTQDYLAKWFQAISEYDMNEYSFFVVLECLVKSSWSPIPLYFIADSMSKVQRKYIWDSKCLLIIKKILLETLKTQCVFIRSAIQCRLLKCITQLSKECIEINVVVDILGHFSGYEALQRGTSIWDACVKWLLNYEPLQIELINLCHNRIFNINSTLSIHACARSLIIFYDTNIQLNGSANSTLIEFFNSILEQFKDCDKRAYASFVLQDRCLDFITCIIDECSSTLNGNYFVELIETHLTLLLRYIEYRLKRGSIDDFESIKLYISFLESVFSLDYLLKKSDFIPLYKTALNSIRSNDISYLHEYLSLKIIGICYECSYNNDFNKGKLLKVYEQDIVESIFLKRLFDKDSISIFSNKIEQNSRGKIISELMKILWSIFYIFLLSRSDSISTVMDLFPMSILMSTALNAVYEDGKQALEQILKSFSILLPFNSSVDSGSDFISESWTACFELRKSELFWLAINQWMAMVYQEKIIHCNAYHALIYKYSKEIMEQGDELVGLVDILMTHISSLNLPIEFSFLISDGLTFGSIARKDRRIEYEVCQHIIRNTKDGLIESFGSCTKPIRSDKEVRLKALDLLINSKNLKQRIELISSVINDLLEKDVALTKNNKRYFNDSIIHRKKHRILQAILILENYVYNSSSPQFSELPKKIFDWAFVSLQEVNQQPSVRYQLEWVFVRLCIHYPIFLHNFWPLFNQAGGERIGSMCSFISIAYHLAALLKDSKFAEHCLENIIPWCMSQNFNLRLYSQVVFSKLYDLYPEISQKFNFIRQHQTKMFEQGNILTNTKKMQSDFYFSYFHSLGHFTLQTIYWDLPRLSNISAEEWMPQDILEKYTNLLVNCNENGNFYSLENCCSPTWITRATEEGDGELETSSIQKKFIPWKGMLPDHEEPIKQSRSGVILVASLIDKAANLGGLARTCEIFSAKELVIPNLEILKDKEFLGLSMTAEKHLYITEVKPFNLYDYLKLMKKRGCVLVGLEQTTGSISLATYKFPKDCILLLGNEREGIPAKLIPLLDYCVEIPQLGVIRSLNVHVSGALFLWEYSKQHYFVPQ